MRGLKQASQSQIEERRQQVAEALAGVVELEFWNAGGSGSVETTAADPVVTEVAAGSGLLVPTLFDHYRSFDPRPAAFFALPVVRRPSAGIATVHGGGLVASGPAGRDRLPTPWLPEGLHLTALEGAGEVQTPLTGPGAPGSRSATWCGSGTRSPARSSSTPTTSTCSPGDAFVDRVETYRGHGLAF